VERERRLLHPCAMGGVGEEAGDGGRLAGMHVHDDAAEVVLWGLRAAALTERGGRRIGSHGPTVQVSMVGGGGRGIKANEWICCNLCRAVLHVHILFNGY
jgi:hypothetical protein